MATTTRPRTSRSPKAKNPLASAAPQKASANLTLSFGLVAIDVSLKPAIESPRSQNPGTLLCPEHQAKTSQKYICGLGEPHEHILSRGDLVTGYETFKKSGEYIVLDDELISALVQERTPMLEITKIVPAESIEPGLFDKAYLTWPQSQSAGQPFDLLATVLRDDDLAAVCHGVLSKRTRAIIFRWSPMWDCLVAHTCHFDAQVRHTDIELARLGADQRGALGKAHVDMARELIGSLESEFDAAEVADDWNEGLTQLLDQAARGKTPTVPKTKTAAKTDGAGDLLATLRASVAATSKPKRKPAAKRKK